MTIFAIPQAAIRTLVLLATAILSTATASPHAAKVRSPATILRDAGESLPGSLFGESSGESSIDSVAIAAGFRPLRESSLRFGSRELRIWIGGGIVLPEDLYRIRIDHGKVRGQSIRYWERKGRFEQRSGVSQVTMMRYTFDGRCVRIGTAGNVDACITRFTKTPEWESLLRRIEADSVWTLRDQSEMPLGRAERQLPSLTVTALT